MYRALANGLCSLWSLFFINVAYAERLQVGSSLAGYQCYHIDATVLKLTPEDAWKGIGFPPVFEGPSEASGKLGVASGIVYVAWPLHEENGFVQVLRFEGQRAWISRSVIRPLYRDPGSKGGCVLSWHGDRVQYHLDPGAKAWLFRDGHNIPDDKIR